MDLLNSIKDQDNLPLRPLKRGTREQAMKIVKRETLYS
jgi:hypothetical protein